MATHPLYIELTRNVPSQKAHMAIFVSSSVDPGLGTRVHVVGNPFLGYNLEVARKYRPGNSVNQNMLHTVETINIRHGMKSGDAINDEGSDLYTDIERFAASCPAPGVFASPLGPVDHASILETKSTAIK